MHIRNALSLAAVLATCATARAAPTSPAEEPLPPGVELAPATLIATVDGEPLTCGDLPEAVCKAGEFRARRAAAREKAFRAQLDDVLLGLEAKRRGVTVAALWQAEVAGRVGPATDEDLQAEFEKRRPWFEGKRFESVRATLEGLVLHAKLEAREEELARGLEVAFPVKPGASPAVSGPADEVLATVGKTQVRRRDTTAAMRRADQQVRVDLYMARVRVADGLVDERLAAAEATRRGVAVDELRKDRAAMGRLQEGHEVKWILEAPPDLGWTPDVAGSPARGPAGAPVTVVEYADFQCPFCGKSWPMVHDALAPYGDRVRYVFRNVPLPYHEHALLAAQAARAAQAQGKFFEYADLLFDHPEALDRASLLFYAGRIGLDEARFRSELDSGRYRPEILWERRDAFRSGLRSTPSLLVNDQPVPTGSDLGGSLRKAVDAALAGSGTGAPRPAGR